MTEANGQSLDHIDLIVDAIDEDRVSGDHGMREGARHK